jgi:hypothetical protein
LMLGCRPSAASSSTAVAVRESDTALSFGIEVVDVGSDPGRVHF